MTRSLYFGGKTTESNGLQDTKNLFSNFYCINQFLKYSIIYFIQIVFMYEVGKCPKQRGSDSLLLLHHSMREGKKEETFGGSKGDVGSYDSSQFPIDV